MYELPKEFSGSLVCRFDSTEKYGKDVFFSTETVHLTDSPLGSYIEGSGKPYERFGFRFRIRDISKPHMLVVRYPDDKRRHMLINDCFSYDLSTGVCSGCEYPVSGEAKELRYVFRTRSNDLTLTFMTWGIGEPAAIFGFAVYELFELPSTQIESRDNHRSIGVQYEDPCGALSDIGAKTLSEWCDGFLEYMKLTGQNRLVHPINWYHGPIFDSRTQPGSQYHWLSLANHEQYTVASTKPYDWITPLLDKFEAAGVEFVGSMTLMRLGTLMQGMNIDTQSINAGADTYNNINSRGEVQTSPNDWTAIYNPCNYEKMIAEGRKNPDESDFEYVYGEKTSDVPAAPMFNPLHPTVRAALAEYFEEIASRFGKHKAFRGVSVNFWHGTLLWFSSLRVGYDDFTVGLFERETGICTGTKKDDPERFAKRYDFMMHRCRKTWIDWRCRKIYELICELSGILRKHNPELMLYLNFWNEPVKRTMFGDFDESVQYPGASSEYTFLLDGGIDLELYKNADGISVSAEQNQHRDRGWTSEGVDLPTEQQRYFHDLAYLDESWSGVLSQSKNSGAFIFDSWTEGWGDHIKGEFGKCSPEAMRAIEETGMISPVYFTNTLKLPPDGFWFESQRQITSCYPTDRNYLEPLAHAVAEFDPIHITRGGLYLDKLHHKEISEYAKAFIPLPAEKFETVCTTCDPVVVRRLYSSGKTYIYAVNREPYAVKLSVIFGCAADFKCFSDGTVYHCENTLSTEIAPFGMISFAADGDVPVTETSADVPKEEHQKLCARYEEQRKCFDALRAAGKMLCGYEQTASELSVAYAQKRPAKLRHILDGYICLKARKFFLNKS